MLAGSGKRKTAVARLEFTAEVDDSSLERCYTYEQDKHRSVTFAEELSMQIASRIWEVDVQHRDSGIVDSEDSGKRDALDSGESNLLS